MVKIAALCLALCLGAFGCIHAAGGVASSTVPIQPGSYRVLGQAKGTDCAYRLLGFLPIGGSNRTSQAVDKAVGDVSGATALVNVSVDTWTHYWILFSNTCTEVRGTAVAHE